MTNKHTQAYGRVVQTLDEIGASKLLPAEQARIRDAADTLIFASDLEEAREALRTSATSPTTCWRAVAGSRSG